MNKSLYIDHRLCMGCDGCITVCPIGCIITDADLRIIDSEICIRCDNCITFCPVGAIGEDDE